MRIQKLREEIAKVDWSSFNGPSMYDAKAVPLALYSLIDLDNSSKAEAVGNMLISALGNNHAGVYYPVVLKALDYIIAVANCGSNDISKICALAVLNDLYYFEPEVEGFSTCAADELKEAVLEKLSLQLDGLTDA